MTDIRKQIDEQWEAFFRDCARPPKYLFVGTKEMKLIDDITGMITLEYRGMLIVVVERDSFICVGDKAREG